MHKLKIQWKKLLKNQHQESWLLISGMKLSPLFFAAMALGGCKNPLGHIVNLWFEEFGMEVRKTSLGKTYHWEESFN